jgi:hypothetical protein
MNSRFVPKIEKPCPANWDEMKGDEKRRFCERCQLHVHNLSAMTAKEQREVVGTTTGRVCVSYTAKKNATPVPTTEWLRSQQSPWWKRGMMAMVASFIALFASQCTRRTTGVMCPPAQEPPKKEEPVPTPKQVEHKQGQHPENLRRRLGYILPPASSSKEGDSSGNKLLKMLQFDPLPNPKEGKPKS